MTTKTDYTSLYIELMPLGLRELRDYAIKVTQELYSHQANPSAYCHINDRYVTPLEYRLLEKLTMLNKEINDREYERWLFDNGIYPDDIDTDSSTADDIVF